MFKKGFMFGLGIAAAKLTCKVVLSEFCKKIFTDEEYLEAFGRDKKGHKPASE